VGYKTENITNHADGRSDMRDPWHIYMQRGKAGPPGWNGIGPDSRVPDIPVCWARFIHLEVQMSGGEWVRSIHLAVQKGGWGLGQYSPRGANVSGWVRSKLFTSKSKCQGGSGARIFTSRCKWLGFICCGAKDLGYVETRPTHFPCDQRRLSGYVSWPLHLQPLIIRNTTSMSALRFRRAACLGS
jgi:hypothetical protein